MRHRLKILLLCTVVCCPLLVKGMVPWAEDKDAAEQSCGTEADSCEVAPDPSLMYSLLPFVVRGQAIRIAVDISRLGPKHAQEQADYETKVRKLYQGWFEEALQWIDIEERKSEFEDIIPILERALEENFWLFVTEDKDSIKRTAEVRFVIFPNRKKFQKEKKEKESVLGLFGIGGEYSPMEIDVTLDTEDAVWFHEIGHSFGFVDEYGDFEEDASPIHRSLERPILSIMQARWVPEENDKNGFTGASIPSCEDAEGLINMMDVWTVRLKKKRHPEIWPDFVSERITKGWRSFEKGVGDYYLLGASVHKLFENLDKLPQPEREIVQRALWENQDEIQLTEKESAFLERYRQKTDDQLKRTFRMKRIGLK